MDTSLVIDTLRDGVWVAIKICGPLLILSMFVGVAIAIFQAVTQIHEQTLSFLLKLVVVVVVCLAAGGWMMETILDFSRNLFVLMRS